MSTISDILETIKGYSPDANLQPVMQAYLMAAKAHAGQTRKSGEPYLSHPIAVAQILADMRMDVETIATALLHDALEDNPITKAEMQAEIGPVVTDLVDGVTKIGKLKFRSKEELQAENFRKMMLAMSKDLRVILVKLADRMHNMRTLGGHGRLSKQQRIARETMDIYVPIANRLGLTRLKSELEDLCFRYLEPEAFETIDGFLKRTQADRIAYAERVVAALSQKLVDEGMDCDVTGRAKHRYSIFKKMVAQDLKVEEVQDLLAFRVLVQDVGACYAVLGLMHANFAPVPDRIKDYIARPKQNGYRSLHTTVVGPEGRRVEVQIRTEEMHRIAEEGIAAHWKYKEGHLALSPAEVARISKIRELFEAARDATDATEFMETVKVEFYSDEVFVFTPAGDVKRFPLGATALDFAYAIHTDVGNRCTGAKVNGRMVPLRYVLQSSDRVSILTAPSQRPNRSWLDIARTGRAISKIRRELREEELDRGRRLGREMIDAELQRFETDIDALEKEGALKAMLNKRGYKDPQHLYAEVAIGHTSLATVVRQLLPRGVYATRQQQEAEQTAIGALINRIRRKTESPVLISGEDGVLVHFAGCCSPLPGEAVIGFITRGKGISVHKAGCDQLASMDPERRIPVEWDGESAARHSGSVRIFCRDRPGLLANITKVCEQLQVNIISAEARNIGDDRAICSLDLSIRDLAELTRLIANIEKIDGVETVERVTG